MQFRMPWIVSRRRLIVAVLFDCALFFILYYALFLQRFGRFPDTSIFLPLLWSIWLFSSYVLGRYQCSVTVGGNFTGLLILQGIGRTILVVAFSLAGTLTYLWLFQSNVYYFLFRSFLVPYLAFLGFFGLLFQVLLGKFLSIRRIETDHWLFLGTPKAYNRFMYHLKWSRFPIRVDHLPDAQLNREALKPIIVDQVGCQSVSALKQLTNLQRQGCLILDRLEWCEIVLQRFPSEYLSEVELLLGQFSSIQGTLETRLKRFGDFTLSALLLVITFPLLVVSALLIKVNDGGPIFYSQVRTGFEGQSFTIWKLRTMRIDAERDGAQWVQYSDPRITKIGYFLRRTRLDELPQLWSVLTGTMSLIGPRPERPEFDNILETHIPHYRLRQLVRPGLSGWAQVNYPYGSSVEDSANKLSYDLYYLRNQCFFLDLLILIKTIRLVLNAKGALPSQKK